MKRYLDTNVESEFYVYENNFQQRDLFSLISFQRLDSYLFLLSALVRSVLQRAENKRWKRKNFLTRTSEQLKIFPRGVFNEHAW